MVIKDEKLNKLNKELQNIERNIDKSKNDIEISELKKHQKKLKEYIRVRTQKILSNDIKEEKISLSANVGYEIVRGNTDVKSIALKYGAKVASVRWYLCQKTK